MSRPKTPSEMHPDYPKGGGIDAIIEFYKAHPEFADEPSYEFQCGMCGNEIDPDHCYCQECEDHSGEWVLVDGDGEIVEESAA